MPHNPLKPVKQVQRLADHIIGLLEFYEGEPNFISAIHKLVIQRDAEEAFRIAIETTKGEIA